MRRQCYALLVHPQNEMLYVVRPCVWALAPQPRQAESVTGSRHQALTLTSTFAVAACTSALLYLSLQTQRNDCICRPDRPREHTLSADIPLAAPHAATLPHRTCCTMLTNRQVTVPNFTPDHALITRSYVDRDSTDTRRPPSASSVTPLPLHLPMSGSEASRYSA